MISEEAGTPEPGAYWQAILSGSDDAFRRAFSACPTLEASVLREGLVGIDAIRAFFLATRSMYDAINFTAEMRSGPRTLLEWEGVYENGAVAGVTSLLHDPSGAISEVRVHHRPYRQVVAFAAGLARRVES